MAVKFEIEEIFKITGRGQFVAAKCLELDKGFWLPIQSSLGGVVLTGEMGMPRALAKDGNIRLDLFFFQIKFEADYESLKKGQVCELFPGNQLDFLPPWMAIQSNGALELELQKEIAEAHLLYKKKVKAIAKREDNDDVLFAISDGQLAHVHLTWKGTQENSPNYPITELFNHWTEVYEKVIAVDNSVYES